MLVGGDPQRLVDHGVVQDFGGYRVFVVNVLGVDGGAPVPQLQMGQHGVVVVVESVCVIAETQMLELDEVEKIFSNVVRVVLHRDRKDLVAVKKWL